MENTAYENEAIQDGLPAVSILYFICLPLRLHLLGVN